MANFNNKHNNYLKDHINGEQFKTKTSIVLRYNNGSEFVKTDSISNYDIDKIIEMFKILTKIKTSGIKNFYAIEGGNIRRKSNNFKNKSE